MMIFSLVAMIGLDKCCITSACLQWLCHSGERIVARGHLVSTSFFAKCLRVGEDGPGRGHLCHTDTFVVSLFHRHILKNRTVLFPTNFISMPEKIGVGLKYQVANL